MPKEIREKAEIKVTDKRIFTAAGDIREEFRDEIRPSEPTVAAATVEPPVTEAAPEAAPKAAPEPTPPPPAAERRSRPATPAPDSGERRRTIAEKGESPGTPFSNFVQSLVMQTYMMLGMLRNPYQPQTKPDVAGARDLIDILSMLREKTAGNLDPEEDEFLSTHLGQLKLAYVQMTKNIS